MTGLNPWQFRVDGPFVCTKTIAGPVPMSVYHLRRAIYTVTITAMGQQPGDP